MKERSNKKKLSKYITENCIMDLLGMKSGRCFQTFGIASLVFLKLVFQCAALFIFLYIITQMGTDT